MQGRKAMRGLVAAATIGVVAVVLAACGPAPGPASSAASDLRAKTDYHRVTNGRVPLAFDAYLEGNAQLHADRLAAGATNCNGMWHSLEMNAWYGGYASGENIACVAGCPSHATTTFYLWRGDPSHNAIMLDSAYAVTGVGVTCNGTAQMIVAHYRSS